MASGLAGRADSEMNPIGELLRVEDIYLDLDVSDKGRLLERLAALLARRHSLSDTQVLESLSAREQLGSTGLGHGVDPPGVCAIVSVVRGGSSVRTDKGCPSL